MPFCFPESLTVPESETVQPALFSGISGTPKVPPHSVEAEQGVLGGVIIHNDSFDSVSEQLQPGDFYIHAHRIIYQALIALAENDQPFDFVTLSGQLTHAGELENAGGTAYLVELIENTPSASNVATYATIVKERSVLRQLIQLGSDVSQQGFNPQGKPSEELLTQTELKLQAIAEGRPKEGGFRQVGELVGPLLDRLDELGKTDSPVTGLTTGYKYLDELTSGWQKGDLIILAARPSMGKTAFAMNAVEHALLNSDKPILVFSLEMPAESILLRMMSSLGKIDQSNLRTGRLDGDDFNRLTSVITKLRNKPLLIDDTPGLSPGEMKARIRKVYREKGEIGLVMVDYLQLMRSANANSRTEEISDISRSLKAIAREFDCPLMALSQLNRSLESRTNKRPLNSDLRESGSIEQDADVILFIYREEVYSKKIEDRGKTEIIIGKQRNGPIGTCNLLFEGKFTRFEDAPDDFMEDDY